MFKPKGFTLIEMILSLAVIAVIAGFSVPVLQSLQRRNDLKLATDMVYGNLRRAQILAKGAANDSAWGVHFDGNSIVVFSGTSYASRVSTSDETAQMSASVFATGTTDFIFNKLSGNLIATGTIILSNGLNESTTIYINEKGTIN